MTIDRALFSSNREDWETPQALFDELNAKYHFDLDPCSTDANAKCANHFTKASDGLKQSWAGHTVFANPPYGRNVTIKWMQKCWEESQNPNTVIVALIHARTDTRWFHEYVYHKADLIFLRGRLKFELNGDPGDSAPFPSMLAIYNNPFREGDENAVRSETL